MNPSHDALHVTWTEPDFPFNVQLSVAALERLRQKSVEGLLALPRIGLGLGGLLLGGREGDGIKVEDFIEIPTSHASGASFNLTADEREHANRLSREERKQTVVGWYLSKTRPPFEPDLTMYADFCPEPWQITLLIVPSAEEMTKARLFYRASENAVATGQEREIPETSVVTPPVVVSADESPEIDAGAFHSVRSFGLVPRTSNRKRVFAAPTSPPPPTETPADGPWGFTPAPSIKLKGQVSKPLRIANPSDVVGEPTGSFEAVRSVRFVGKKASAASPLHPELEEMARTEIPAYEPKPAAPPPPLPDGPIEFAPVRRIDFSKHETLPPVKARPAQGEADPPEQTNPSGSGGFQPTRKSMFTEELRERSVPSNEAVAETPTLELTKSIQFAEAEPAKNTAPAAPAPLSDVTPIRTASFMTAEEKKDHGRHLRLMEELQKEDEVVPEEMPARPEAILRRKFLLGGGGALTVGTLGFLTRDLWLPKPLKLELTESNGHITALWNAETLPSGADGTLTINDGGKSTVIRLNATKLAEGVTGFDRTADQISATLKVADKTASAAWKP